MIPPSKDSFFKEFLEDVLNEEFEFVFVDEIEEIDFVLQG